MHGRVDQRPLAHQQERGHLAEPFQELQHLLVRAVARLRHLRLQQVHFIEAKQKSIRRRDRQIIAQQPQGLLHACHLPLGRGQLQPQSGAPLCAQEMAQRKEDAVQIIIQTGTDRVPEGASRLPGMKHGRAQAALADTARTAEIGRAAVAKIAEQPRQHLFAADKRPGQQRPFEAQIRPDQTQQRHRQVRRCLLEMAVECGFAHGEQVIDGAHRRGWRARWIEAAQIAQLEGQEEVARPAIAQLHSFCFHGIPQGLPRLRHRTRPGRQRRLKQRLAKGLASSDGRFRPVRTSQARAQEIGSRQRRIGAQPRRIVNLFQSLAHYGFERLRCGHSTSLCNRVMLVGAACGRLPTYSIIEETVFPERSCRSTNATNRRSCPGRPNPYLVL